MTSRALLLHLVQAHAKEHNAIRRFILPSGSSLASMIQARQPILGHRYRKGGGYLSQKFESETVTPGHSIQFGMYRTVTDV